ncbi:MAG: amidohydrolase [Bacteroidales bacterium]
MEIETEELKELRRELHKYPELSGKEHNTARLLKTYLKKYKPDEIIDNIGGHGFAVIYRSNNPGSTILFRADLDALPINEVNNFSYKSQHEGISHKCGHDGHMTILTGLAQAISQNRPQKGSVILLFQPSEENGEGAEKVINDPKFKSLKPDYVYALHNLPGFPKGSIIINPNIFASASKGLIVKLTGKTSHAGEPENGISPAIAMADLVKELTYLPSKQYFENFVLITVIYARLGEIAFGTSPGYAEVMATLRSYTNEDMESLVKQSKQIIVNLSDQNNLKYKINWTEEFLATKNTKQSVDIIQQAAESSDIEVITKDKPFHWSEDFSHFTYKFPGALFGLGSGENTPQLHNPDYDFPEEIIIPGVKIFCEIFKRHLNQ